MKKIIIVSSFVLLSVMSYGQSTVAIMKSNYGSSSDTAVNTGTANVDVQLKGSHEQISIQAVVTKISGTVAGTVLLQGSNDGTNYVNLNTDTLTNTNVTTNTKVWVIDYNPYMYYRVLLTGAGTMSATIKGYALTTGISSIAHYMATMKSNYELTSDTITNAGSGYLEFPITEWFKRVSIQSVVTKLSGTAGGTVTVQGSNDGTNFVTVNSSYITSQTQTVTNVTTSTKLFIITGTPYKYYRLNYVGTGTMSCTIKGYLLPSK